MTTDLPDVGTCPVCRKEKRLKRDGTLYQHWTWSAPRRLGYPPCDGKKPTAINASRTAYALAAEARPADDIVTTVVDCSTPEPRRTYQLRDRRLACPCCEREFTVSLQVGAPDSGRECFRCRQDCDHSGQCREDRGDT